MVGTYDFVFTIFFVVSFVAVIALTVWLVSKVRSFDSRLSSIEEHQHVSATPPTTAPRAASVERKRLG